MTNVKKSNVVSFKFQIHRDKAAMRRGSLILISPRIVQEMPENRRQLSGSAGQVLANWLVTPVKQEYVVEERPKYTYWWYGVFILSVCGHDWLLFVERKQRRVATGLRYCSVNTRSGS